MKKLKVIKPLIIGLGMAGKRHLDAQVKLGNATGVYTRNLGKVEEVVKKNPKVIFFNSLVEGLNWSNLVHICTPDDLHTDIVALAIKKGQAVLCEKPLTTSLKDAKALQMLCQKNNGTLIVGQNYRLTPSFMRSKKLVQKGSLGTITGIETTYLHDMTEYRLANSSRNRQDFLYVGGSHAVDLALFIAGEKIVSVFAKVGNKIRADYGGNEKYQIIIKFASGLLGHIALDASSIRVVNGTDLMIEGEKGWLKGHNKIDDLVFFKKGARKAKKVKMPNVKTLTTVIEVKIINDYLIGKKDSYWPLPGVDEAVEVIKVLDAIEKSVLSGKEIYID